MKKGFTLAETLVTLVAIGIVAVITIPLMGANYEKRTQYAAFLKMYNTLETVMDVATADHKKPDKWVYNGSDPSQTLRRYIYPYLKIKRICEDEHLSSCVSEYDYYDIGGPKEDSTENVVANGKAVILDNGAWVSMGPTDFVDGKINGLFFTFDINGAKGPNKIGRDMFILTYVPNNGVWSFMLDSSLATQDCDPSNSESIGTTCAIRLIKDGKMAY